MGREFNSDLYEEYTGRAGLRIGRPQFTFNLDLSTLRVGVY